MALDPDLFASVVEALEAAGGELKLLSEGDSAWPVPDKLQAILDQREALLATMSLICQSMEAKGRKGWADRIRSLYKQELKTAHGDYAMPPAPVSDEVTGQVAEALERVRRARCVDGDVRDALEMATIK